MNWNYIYQHYWSSPEYPNQRHNYLSFLIELPNGKRHWYRASPKIYNALKWDQKLHGKFPLTKLVGYYINIPVTPYFGQHEYSHAKIGVGKIIYIKFKEMDSNNLCTRSQFVSKDDLKHDFKHCYHFLKHDYGKYSHLQIYLDLHLWQQKLKRGE